MPPDVVIALGNTSMRAAVSENAGSIIHATIHFSIQVRRNHKNCPRWPAQPVHRGRCPRPLDDALKPLLVECVMDCLEKHRSVPPHAANVTPVQVARISRIAAQQLARYHYLTEEQCLQVTTSMYGLAVAVMGDNTPAVSTAGVWLRGYLERVLKAYNHHRR
jgi:hypothetical protein